MRKCWQTVWGRLEQVRVPRLRGRKAVGLLEKYQRHALDEVLFALTGGGLSQRKEVQWGRRFLGGTLSPAAIGAVLAQARQEVERRRQGPLSSRSFPARGVDGIHLRYRRHRLRTTNLAEGFFRHLRRYLGRFPGCVDAAHSEQVLGCFILACEQAHA
jgi:transposase-like protein